MSENNKIKLIKAREILDSRGFPTVEVELITNLGSFFSSVPSGASKGKYEAIEIRDNEKRYQGRGVLKAVNNVNKIIGPKLKGEDVVKQKKIDEFLIKLDGTKDKSRLGANVILPVSMAVSRASAFAKNISLYEHIFQLYSKVGSNPILNIKLPTPCFNVINGGAHAGNELDFQEFMIVPQNNSFSENLRIGSEIYQTLKEILKKKFGKLATNLGDEGGFAPQIKNPEEAIKLILEAAKKIGYQNKIKIIIDVAASQFFLAKKYKTNFGNFNQEELVNYYLDLIKKYHILGLEDPFAEDDFRGWEKLKLKIEKIKLKTLVIGDDLLATNSERIKMAKEKEFCNAAIIKINQIGTITEAIESVKLAKSFNWKIIVSHRSGETCDDFISDFAVGISAHFVKFGAPARGERVAKYNRLLKIEEELL